MNINEIEIGTKIYYRGDMANKGGFGEIIKLVSSKYGNCFTTELEDGRIQKMIPIVMLHNVDTGDGRTRFCTQVAYDTRRNRMLKSMTKSIKSF